MITNASDSCRDFCKEKKSNFPWEALKRRNFLNHATSKIVLKITRVHVT